MLGRVTGVVALVAALATAPARAQRAEACERCHSNREFLVQAAGGAAVADSFVVTRTSLARDKHAAIPCSGCHVRASGFPHLPNTVRVVSCVGCHIAQDTLWRSGVHGPYGGSDARATCVNCHGSHHPPTAGFMHTAEGRAAMRRACENCHAQAVQTSQVGVHADSVACIQCHGVHDMRPVPDPATKSIDIVLARACSRCHPGVARTYWTDIHGRTAQAQARGALPLGVDTAATCIACHGEHGIRRHDDPTWRFAVADACSRCHPRYGTTYRDSYHGQATRVGSRKAAQCHNCHPPHHVLPEREAASSVAPANVVTTCRQCHAEARGNFAGYQPHANPRNRGQNAPLFWVWLAMNTILFGTITVWGVHAAIWFFRNWRERGNRIAAHAAARGEKVPMDSALRGGPPYVWRFNVIFRVIHAMIVVTFFLLVVTGLPLRFSCTAWAPGLMGLLGGAEVAGRIHRITGLFMFGYFILYVVYLVGVLVRSPRKRDLLVGANSILFREQDLLDVIAMMKYFFGRGPHPRFGRFSYMEKFDYFAELWGVGAIGFTGLMLWFPTFFALFFPGILFNIAIIIHSYEAMIATAFIFTIHFFNVHLRPEKWPLDAVMFTGRASLAYMKEEHPLVAEAIAAKVEGAPVSVRAVADRPAPPPPAWMNTFGAFAGLLLLGIGVVLIGLILWGSLC